jgi:hypothetical protein
MWFVFFFLFLIGAMALLFYLLIELNEFEKKINTAIEDIKNHYEQS